jgi:hypothetical protein
MRKSSGGTGSTLTYYPWTRFDLAVELDVQPGDAGACSETYVNAAIPSASAMAATCSPKQRGAQHDDGEEVHGDRER